MAEVGDPAVIIAPAGNTNPDAVYILNVWRDANVSHDMEFTTTPTAAGSTVSEIRRVLPRIANVQVSISDDRTDEERETTSAESTEAHLKRRIAALVALRGQLVQFTCRALSFAGAASSVRVLDSGQWDNGMIVEIEVREILEASSSGNINRNIFGTIKIPFNPATPVGGGPITCVIGGTKRKSNAGKFFSEVAGASVTGLLTFATLGSGTQGLTYEEFTAPGTRAYWKGVGGKFSKMGKDLGKSFTTAIKDIGPDSRQGLDREAAKSIKSGINGTGKWIKNAALANFSRQVRFSRTVEGCTP